MQSIGQATSLKLAQRDVTKFDFSRIHDVGRNSRICELFKERHKLEEICCKINNKKCIKYYCETFYCKIIN